MSGLWQPLSLSLRIALVATALVSLIAIPLAFTMARHRFPGKSILEALITLPLVLPPTVVGYILIVTLGAHGWIGSFLHRTLGYSILFRFEGAVLASAVVALPLLYLPAKAAFSTVDREFEDIARLFGASPLQLFWRVSLPLARRGIANGIILAFARALGEFGATLMVFGWQPNRITLPISIYTDYEQGNWTHSIPAVLALTLISVTLIAVYNRSSTTSQE